MDFEDHFMKLMNAFVCLPRELLSLLVTEWLNWSDLGHCDSAMGNTDLRKVWLDLLRNGCIFRDILPISWDYNLYFGWILSRSVRAISINIDWCPLVDENTVDCWFQHAGPCIQSLTFRNVVNVMMNSIARYCNNLDALSAGDCSLDESFWEIIANNPQLQKLNIVGYARRACPVPTDLSLPFLHSLKIGYHAFTSEDIVVLLQQLPSLRSLKLDQIYLFGADMSLSSVALPKLVHLQVENACNYVLNRNSSEFVKVLENLQSPLRCLIVPGSVGLTVGELQTIEFNHGHSLRCLSIYGSQDRSQSTLLDFAESLNQMPLLHTLQLPHRCLANIATPITNSSITHLYVDLISPMDLLKDVLSNHFPSLHTVSLFWLPPEFVMPDIVVYNLSQLLELRPLIRTICVDNNVGMFDYLRAALSHIDVEIYSPIDVFTANY